MTKKSVNIISNVSLPGPADVPEESLRLRGEEPAGLDLLPDLGHPGGARGPGDSTPFTDRVQASLGPSAAGI